MAPVLEIDPAGNRLISTYPTFYPAIILAIPANSLVNPAETIIIPPNYK
jgi:hypothetical protein